jgi:hypothetical protein
LTAAEPTSALSAHDEAEWLRLRNTIVRERAFWLGVLLAESPLGVHQVVTRADELLASTGAYQWVSRPSNPEEMADATARLLAGTETVGLVWIIATAPFDIGEAGAVWERAWLQTVQALNRQRDTLRCEHPHGVVLVGPPGLLRVLATEAVDLWSVRSFVGELASDPVITERPADVVVAAPSALGDLPVPDELAAQIREVRRLIESDEAHRALDAAMALSGSSAAERLAIAEAQALAARAAHLVSVEIDAWVTATNLADEHLGSDNPSTLTSRNNLASAYESAGQLDRAIPLHEQTLTDRERILGPNHPDTLTSRNNLANAYRSAGWRRRIKRWWENRHAR